MKAAGKQGLLGQRTRDAVVEADERVVVAGGAAVKPGLLGGGLLVARVVPPLARAFRGGRDHPGEQHEQPRGELAGGQGRGERAVGLPHDRQVPPAGGRTRDGGRVVGEGGRFVVARQVGRDRVVSPGAQLRLGQVPVPAGVAGAVDQHESRHRYADLSRVRPDAGG